MPELDKRLLKIAECVRKGSVVADIGTDHAYLPLYLVKKGICKSALACDVRKGPLLNAQKSVKDAGAESLIELRQSDGLSKINAGECDDIVISGLGGTLMKRILSECNWLKDKRYNLILAPQSHAYEVIDYLVRNGFEIYRDFVTEDNGFVYYIFCARYNGEIKDYDDSFIWFGNALTMTETEALKYRNRVLKYIKTRYDCAKEFGKADEEEYFGNIIKTAEEIINEN